MIHVNRQIVDIVEMFQISNQVLEDLAFLESLSSDTTSEFCKLVTAELSKLHLLEQTIPNNDSTSKFGVSSKVLESAAKRLRSIHSDVTSDKVALTLQAIAHLYVEAAKQKMGPDDILIFLKYSVTNVYIGVNIHTCWHNNFDILCKVSL